MAEWLGRGLQSLVHRFESGPRLQCASHRPLVWIDSDRGLHQRQVAGHILEVEVVVQVDRGRDGGVPDRAGNGRASAWLRMPAECQERYRRVAAFSTVTVWEARQFEAGMPVGEDGEPLTLIVLGPAPPHSCPKRRGRFFATCGALVVNGPQPVARRALRVGHRQTSFPPACPAGQRSHAGIGSPWVAGPARALWEALPVAEPRPHPAGDAHKQSQTCEREHGARKQAALRVLAEQRSIGSGLLRGVVAEYSRCEDSFGRAVCAAA